MDINKAIFENIIGGIFPLEIAAVDLLTSSRLFLSTKSSVVFNALGKVSFILSDFLDLLCQ